MSGLGGSGGSGGRVGRVGRNELCAVTIERIPLPTEKVPALRKFRIGRMGKQWNLRETDALTREAYLTTKGHNRLGKEQLRIKHAVAPMSEEFEADCSNDRGPSLQGVQHNLKLGRRS